MNKIVVVIDMQNDFISGTLGSKEALEIVKPIENYLNTQINSNDLVVFTRDTHYKDEESLEMKLLPKHCMLGTKGHEIEDNLSTWICKNGNVAIVNKDSFVSIDLPKVILTELRKRNSKLDDYEIHIFGLCTDICVVSNALLLRGHFVDTPIYVHRKLCAGSTPEAHLIALGVMKNNLITII